MPTWLAPPEGVVPWIEGRPVEQMRVWQLIDGEWLPRVLDPDPEITIDPVAEANAILSDARRRATMAINASAGSLRRIFVTDLPAQEMIYLKKEAEAQRYMGEIGQGLTPDLATYHWMPREVGITAPNADQLAQIWLNLAEIWLVVGPLIEEARLGSIAQIEMAPDLSAVDGAVAGGLAALAALRAAAAGAAA